MKRGPITDIFGRLHLFCRRTAPWCFLCGLLTVVASSWAQDLAPRAYVVTPLHSNAVVLTWSYYNGGVNFNGTIPITGATGTYNVPIVTLYHSFNFFGRSANITGSLPYAVGNFRGDLLGTHHSLYRSGLLDLSARLSVNLIGGPAMQPKEFMQWKQNKILGASLKIVAPTGQYDPTKLINWGSNRWAFKPELGYSQRWGDLILDGYGGVWFYTTNTQYYHPPQPLPQTEAPIGSFEGHLSYDFHRFGWLKGKRGWASLDGNFWFGGVTSVSGIKNLASKQTGSRIGATISLPYSRHQSIKVAYSDGTYIRFGGNYQNLQVAWQYSWLGRPK